MRRRSSRRAADVLAGLDRGRLPARRGREPVDRLLRPADARPDVDDRSTTPARRSSGRWRTPRRRLASTPAAATKARSTGSTPRARARVLRQRRARGPRARARPGGGIYVGTSPQGKIYKVDATGKASVFFDPADRYIWSLAVDRSGNVFAATGDKGVIYKITPDGKGTVFYETKATHAMTLAFDTQGRLLAGTESPGRVFRIDPAGKPFVILDSSYNEIRTIRVDKDGNDLRDRGQQPRRRHAASDTPADSRHAAPTPVVTEITAEYAIGSPSRRRRPAAAQTPRSTGPVTGAIYRISPTARRIWCGSRARTRPTTSPSKATATCSSPPATRARSIACPASRISRRWSRAPTSSRSPRSCRARRAHALRHVQSRASCSGCRRPRGARHLHLRRARRADRRHVGHDSLAGADARRDTRRDLHALGQHPHARRDLERLERCLREPTAARSPARVRAICSGGRSSPAPRANRRC